MRSCHNIQRHNQSCLYTEYSERATFANGSQSKVRPFNRFRRYAYMSALMSVLSSAGSSSRDAARSSWSPSTFSRFCRTTTGMRTALQIAKCNSDSSHDAIPFFCSTRHPCDTPHTPLRLQSHITRSCATPATNSGSAPPPRAPPPPAPPPPAPPP